MRCFEVVGEIVFVCFANGKMGAYDKGTQAAIRKPLSAHASEIKYIARGHGDILLTSCIDNQVFACSRTHGNLVTMSTSACATNPINRIRLQQCKSCHCRYARGMPVLTLCRQRMQWAPFQCAMTQQNR
jgi:hypothetical protein